MQVPPFLQGNSAQSLMSADRDGGELFKNDY